MRAIVTAFNHFLDQPASPFRDTAILVGAIASFPLFLNALGTGVNEGARYASHSGEQVILYHDQPDYRRDYAHDLYTMKLDESRREHKAIMDHPEIPAWVKAFEAKAAWDTTVRGWSGHAAINLWPMGEPNRLPDLSTLRSRDRTTSHGHS